MRKYLFLVMLLLSAKARVIGSHLMGGQITARNIGGLTYEITETVYRDTVGIPIGTAVLFSFNDLANTWSYADSASVSPAVAMGNGIEQYQYIDTLTFPSTGDYEVSTNVCCRNAAIQN